jgi:hypothetical protein
MKQSFICVSLFLSLFFCLLCIHSSSALYEEQVGSVDWFKTQLGHTRAALFPANQKKRYIYLATEQNAIASIRQKNGEIQWRQVLPQAESIQQLRLIGKNTLVANSIKLTSDSSEPQQENIVRAFNVADGTLLFDTSTGSDRLDRMAAAGSSHYPTDIIPLDSNQENSAVAVLNVNQVSLYSNSGSQLWSRTLRQNNYADESVSNANYFGIAVLAKNNEVFAFGNEGKKQIVHVLAASDGSVKSENAFPTDDFTFDCLVLHNSGFALILTHANTLKLFNIFTQTEISTQKIVELLGITEAPAQMKLNNINFNSAFELETEDSKYFIVITAKALKLVEKYELSTFIAGESQPTQQNTVNYVKLSQKIIEKSGQSTSLLSLSHFSYDFTAQKAQFQAKFGQEIPYNSHGTVLSIFFRLSDGGKVLILGQDSSLSLFNSSGGLEFCREEALGMISSVDWADLPPENAQNLHINTDSNVYPGFFQRIGPQIAGFGQSLAQLAHFDWENVLQTVKNSFTGQIAIRRPQFHANSPLSQDYFGFKKLILAVSSGGKIFSLETEGGNVAWGAYLGGKIAKIHKIYTVSHNFCVILAEEEAESVIFKVNTLTGEIIQRASLGFSVIYSFLAPVHDEHHNFPVILIESETKSVNIFPNNQETRQILANQLGNIYFYLVEKASNRISGYFADFSVPNTENSYNSNEIWAISFPSSVESLSSWASADNSEVIQSSVRLIAQGEGGVLFKYLNPNLLVVATVRIIDEKGNFSTVSAIKKGSDPSVNMYFIDIITGKIIEKLVHKGCTGPIALVSTENILVYSYFNVINNNHEISVVELYETKDSSQNSLLAAILSSGSKLEPFNSYTSNNPYFLQQTYIFKHGIKQLAVSKSRRGISSKEFLAITQYNQLLGIPKVLLDPRRPVQEPTALDKQEGLIPYQGELYLDERLILSYNLTIAAAQSITTSPALLESTSMTFTYGLDLFFRRIQPSQGFDLLNEDFNYVFLIATVTLVIALIVITKQQAKKKELANAWK